MLFNTLTFVLFNFLFLALFWLSRSLLQRNFVLLTSSLVFYAWFYWPALFLLLLMLVFNYFMSLRIEQSSSKKVLTCAVAGNLLVLGFFKYSQFFIENLIALFSLLGLELKEPTFSYWLPLGISFYTFQIIAYLVDVYRKDVQVERSFIQFAVFKCFYGQLIAGPIVRAKEFLPQLKSFNKFDPALFHLGLYYMIAGLFIKIGIADTVSQFVDFGFAEPEKLNALNAWGTMYGFAVQILADFWGYSTIAVGIGYMYGIKLPINFNAPYSSTSITEFWRKWHITLSGWLRDYLYIPLGGSRNKLYRNLFLTMVLGGLWHGASWTFILWGAGHGIWLILERLGQDLPFKDRVPNLLKKFFVFNGVCLLWVFFRAEGLDNALHYFAALSGAFQSDIKLPSELINQILLFMLFCWYLGQSLRDKSFLSWRLRKQFTVSLALLFFILSFANAKLDFIYFVF